MMKNRIRAIIAAGMALSVLPVHADNEIPVYRMYNTGNGQHLLSADKNERNVLYYEGWTYEGIVMTVSGGSSIPVYRLRNPYTGEHLYTADENEYMRLPSYGWQAEGICFYADETDAVPVYRLYNPYSGQHLFTSDVQEYNALPAYGWIQENTAWYSCNPINFSDDLQTGNYYYGNLLVIANKKHPLPSGYVPSGLRYVQVVNNGNTVIMCNEAAGALERMFAGARADGITLISASAYRSEQYQARLYNGYVRTEGQAAADRESSRPGYSDHQTGLAVDISDHDGRTFLTAAMFNTPEGQWLYQHAHEYGFILRYPSGKESITGYSFEPWHYRYVGTAAAESMYAASPDLTLEEYCGISGGDY